MQWSQNNVCMCAHNSMPDCGCGCACPDEMGVVFLFTVAGMGEQRGEERKERSVYLCADCAYMCNRSRQGCVTGLKIHFPRQRLVSHFLVQHECF